MLRLIWSLLACGGAEPPAPVEAPAAAAPAPRKQARDEDEEAPVGKNRPPRINDVLFRPEHPVKGDTIEARVLGEDPDKDAVEISTVWVVNGERWLDQTTRSLSGDGLKRGDQVQLEVTVSDGVDTVTQQSRTITVGNTPPELLTPLSAFSDINGLEVQASDVDGDRLSYRLDGAPDGMSIDDRGKITYEGSETAAAGTYKVTLTVDDGHTGTARLSFGMTVAGGQTERRVKKGSAEATGSEAPPG